jgi:hypothetical protein
MKSSKQNSSCSTEEDGNSFKREDHGSGKAEHKAELAQIAEAKHETRNPRRSLLSHLSRVAGRLEEETT